MLIRWKTHNLSKFLITPHSLVNNKKTFIFKIGVSYDQKINAGYFTTFLAVK